MSESEIRPTEMMILSPIDGAASEASPRPRVWSGAWKGARVGFRRASFLSVPISVVWVSMGFSQCEIVLVAGRGFGIHPILVQGLGFFLISEICSGVLGAGITLVVALIHWARSQSGSNSLWARLNRPIARATSQVTISPQIIESKAVLPVVQQRTRRLWPWLVGIPVFLVLLSAFGAGVYLGRVVDKRLGLAIAATDRENPKWRIDDLMANRERVPDDENSALVVAEVIALLPESWPAAPLKRHGRPASASTPVMQAFDQAKATSMNVRLDDETTAMLRKDLEAHREAVSLARTTADFPRGRHEVKLTRAFLDTLLRETRYSRGVARLLCADAAIQAQDGNADGALNSSLAILNVGRSIGDEPFLVSGMVRVEIGSIAIESAQRAMAMGEPSDDALARLQHAILTELSDPKMLRGIRGERAMFDELIRRIANAEVPVSALGGSDSTEIADPVSPWGRLAFDHQHSLWLDWMREAVEIAKQPLPRRPPLWKAWNAEISRVQQSWHSKYTATLPLLLMPSMANAENMESHYRCELGAMAILLAAERHRRKTGEWPKSINGIDPLILAAPPLDPFTQKPFKIESKGGQFLVHSVGPNLKDEHGAYATKLWTSGSLDDIGVSGWNLSLRRQSREPTDSESQAIPIR